MTHGESISVELSKDVTYRVTFVKKHLSPHMWVDGVLPNNNQNSQVKEFRIKIISLIGIRHKCLLCCIHVLVNICIGSDYFFLRIY